MDSISADFEALGTEWSLTRALLWVRFRNPRDVILFGGVLESEANAVQTSVSAAQALKELWGALARGEISATGSVGDGWEGAEHRDVPSATFVAATWQSGWDYLLQTEPIVQFWSEVRLTAADVVRRWPPGAGGATKKRGRKPDREIDRDRLMGEIAEASSRVGDDPVEIAADLLARGRYGDYGVRYLRGLIKSELEVQRDRARRK